jgi:ElaB/YqjD/DUF883 family membrane-anchored ribosome-binding protein
MTDTLDETANDISSAAGAAVERGQKAFNEAMATAQAKITETARIASKALKEQADALAEQTREYRENAGQQFGDAQRYVVDKVKENPVAAAVTGFSIGLLLGVLLSNRSK